MFERAHDQLVILLLWQTRNRNSAGNSHALDDQWERSTMSGIVTFREQILLFNRLPYVLQGNAHIIRAMPKSVDHPVFALDPFAIVDRCTRHREVKQLLTAAGDIYRHRLALILRR